MLAILVTSLSRRKTVNLRKFQQLESSPPSRSPLDSPVNSLLSGLFLTVLCFFIAQIVLATLLQVFPGWLDAFNQFMSGTRTDSTACMVFRWLQGINSLLFWALAGFLWASLIGNPFAQLGMSKKPRINLLLVAALTLIVAMPFVQFFIIPDSQVTSEWLKSQGTSAAVNQLLGDDSLQGILANVFFICFLPAFAEEIFFRGFLQQAVGRLIPPLAAVVVAAAVFSLVHMQLLVFLPRFILGLLLGYFFLRTGKLWVSVAAHFAFNALNVVIAFLAMRGFLTKELFRDDYRFPLWITLISGILTLILMWGFHKLSTSEKISDPPLTHE
jgi:uncharacterized protein